MDCMAPRDKNIELDLEKGLTISEEKDQITNPISCLKNKAQMLLSKFKGSFSEGSDDTVLLSGDASNSGSINVEVVTSMNKEGQECKDIGKENNKNKVGKEKLKNMGNKKAPKPPRPPRAPSLDAVDHRLIKELAELARLKRARVERMKALKNMKAAKGISSNTSIFAMVFTIIFCIVTVYQGMPSRGTPTNFEGSEIPVGAMEGGLISIELFGNPSSSIPHRPDFGSPLYVI